MKIACLSGKGGAGKTFVAVNLAVAAGGIEIESGNKEQAGSKPVTYIDCDVEEPNGRLFFKPEMSKREVVSTLLPEFDKKLCTGCKKCVQFCRFHALIYVKEKPMVFSEVCHSCGGCMLVCPENAVTEKPKPIGELEIGSHKNIKVVTGILNPGEASGVPVIRDALKKTDGITIIDCPPGSACSVMESAADADYCIMVVEPTAFGFHNFKMVHELLKLLKKKCGVIINKSGEPYEILLQYCKEERIPILAEFPYETGIASLLAEGILISEQKEEVRKVFTGILEKIGGAL